jgi:hypothetical protein
MKSELFSLQRASSSCHRRKEPGKPQSHRSDAHECSGTGDNTRASWRWLCLPHLTTSVGEATLTYSYIPFRSLPVCGHCKANMREREAREPALWGRGFEQALMFSHSDFTSVPRASVERAVVCTVLASSSQSTRPLLVPQCDRD